MRARLLDRGPHLGLLVDREVVEHDDIAGAQRRHQHLFDVGEETSDYRSAHRTPPARRRPSSRSAAITVWVSQ